MSRCVRPGAGYQVFFAGIWGRECWGSTFLRNAPSEDAIVDCDIPCLGDETKSCGGSSFVDVYKADFSDSSLSEETSTVSGFVTAASSTSVTSSTTAPSSMAAGTVDSSVSYFITPQLLLWDLGPDWEATFSFVKMGSGARVVILANQFSLVMG